MYYFDNPHQGVHDVQIANRTHLCCTQHVLITLVICSGGFTALRQPPTVRNRRGGRRHQPGHQVPHPGPAATDSGPTKATIAAGSRKVLMSIIMPTIRVPTRKRFNQRPNRDIAAVTVTTWRAGGRRERAAGDLRKFGRRPVRCPVRYSYFLLARPWMASSADPALGVWPFCLLFWILFRLLGLASALVLARHRCLQLVHATGGCTRERHRLQGAMGPPGRPARTCSPCSGPDQIAITLRACGILVGVVLGLTMTPVVSQAETGTSR